MPTIKTYNRVLHVFLASSMILSINSVKAESCAMSHDFFQKDENAPKGITSVWSNAEKTALMFIESLNVNTDGTRKSYSVADFWGETVALNNLCNAMQDKCAGLTEVGMKNRRILTQQAYAKNWPEHKLKNTKISSGIIAFKNGKPCPLVDGYLVSATSLHKKNITDTCDIENYLDAVKTSAIVIPKNKKVKNPVTGKIDEIPNEFAKRNAKIGDLVVASLPGTNSYKYAVIGDAGPVNSLGEGSIALNGALLGKKKSPENYLEVRGKGKYKGTSWYVPSAVVLIFPGSRNSNSPYLSQDDIDREAKEKFEHWGGANMLNLCADKYLLK